MDGVVAGSGVASLALALSYTGKMLLDWKKSRSIKTPEAVASSAAVSDAATVNAILVASLDRLAGENLRLQARVQHLETVDAQKDQKIAELEARLNQIATELAALKSH